MTKAKRYVVLLHEPEAPEHRVPLGSAEAPAEAFALRDRLRAKLDHGILTVTDRDADYMEVTT